MYALALSTFLAFVTWPVIGWAAHLAFLGQPNCFLLGAVAIVVHGIARVAPEGWAWRMGVFISGGTIAALALAALCWQVASMIDSRPGRELLMLVSSLSIILSALTAWGPQTDGARLRQLLTGRSEHWRLLLWHRLATGHPLSTAERAKLTRRASGPDDALNFFDLLSTTIELEAGNPVALFALLRPGDVKARRLRSG